jgi:hypothetical protein
MQGHPQSGTLRPYDVEPRQAKTNRASVLARAKTYASDRALAPEAAPPFSVAAVAVERIALHAPKNHKLPRTINLHKLGAARRDMTRVYRDLRTNRVGSQDGARLMSALSQIAKMFEMCDLEHRVGQLERQTSAP